MLRIPPTAATADITGALQRVGAGEPEAMNEVFPLVYEALRQMARSQSRRHPAAALTTTALVHETYLDLLGRAPRLWADRGHFYAYAGRAMRSILVDAARRDQAEKRGGQAQAVTLDEAEAIEITGIGPDVLALDAALNRLAALDADLVRLVELRYFAGLPVPEVATLMELAPRSVDRMWQRARALLAQFIT